MAQFDSMDGSPAESYVSTPGDNYPSLFAATTPDATHTVNPLDMMTPQSFVDDKVGNLSTIPEDEPLENADDAASPSGEKKQTKKRKSWGQVLPEPKTNLPPRKRAKTDDEKEQRRVERVLRNRRAAQSSRERKRLEVEALEKRNRDLELALQKAQETNEMLAKELSRVRGGNASPLDSLHNNSLTLSQELFSSQDSKGQSNSLIDDLLVTTNPATSNTNDQTVNPASLSPELGPVPDHHPSGEAGAKAAQSSQAASSDVTQHPAAMLSDLQCHTSEEPLFFPAVADDGALGLDAGGALPSALDADSYVLESGLLDSPNSSAFDDDYLVGDHDTKFSLSSIGLDDLFNHHGHDSDPSDVTAASFFAAAESGLDLTAYDPEIQGPAENFIQQPQSGASLEGCDDGGSAVVF
ncbi:hypothetical protein S40285_01792 [Stachybotrys chlorohalonatus IBT 40285]|uniref:BZIP domain-containing protein n=1 Tax=Stachybotrys chlorohalonatus (strain IBT 40285) TaxID=1283841 RepID=A0A084QHA5_STAC4|nr:hypothetical protein S40285_01792 [Stachybotrys chlorohalonata IBT 40285]